MERVEIAVDPYAVEKELAAIASVAADFGVDAKIRGGYRKPMPAAAEGIGDEPEWIILLVVGSTFGAFFSGIFSAAGTDAWKRLKSFAESLRDTRRRPTGSVIPPSPPHQGAIHFRDIYGNEIREGIYPKSPSKEFWTAWERIDEPDWSQLSGWLAYWDREAKSWAAIEPYPGHGHVYWDCRNSCWQSKRL